MQCQSRVQQEDIPKTARLNSEGLSGELIYSTAVGWRAISRSLPPSPKLTPKSQIACVNDRTFAYFEMVDKAAVTLNTKNKIIARLAVSRSQLYTTSAAKGLHTLKYEMI